MIFSVFLRWAVIVDGDDDILRAVEIYLMMIRFVVYVMIVTFCFWYVVVNVGDRWYCFIIVVIS